MQEESLRGIIAQFLVAEAEPGVVVDESHGLHECIYRHRTAALEAARLEFGGDSVRKLCTRWRGPFIGLRVVGIEQRLAIRERPELGILLRSARDVPASSVYTLVAQLEMEKERNGYD